MLVFCVTVGHTPSEGEEMSYFTNVVVHNIDRGFIYILYNLSLSFFPSFAFLQSSLFLPFYLLLSSSRTSERMLLHAAHTATLDGLFHFLAEGGSIAALEGVFPALHSLAGAAGPRVTDSAAFHP